MSVKVSEIINIIESLAPTSYAYKWDNVGLQLGSKKDDVSRILITLEITDAVLDEAIEKNIDMIIAHHPMIFSSLKKITKEDIKGRLIYKAIKNDITIYAAHTNIDIAPGGLNDYLANKLSIKDASILEEIDKGDYPVGTEKYLSGIGRIGKLDKPKTLENLAEEIKVQINSNHIKAAGNLKAIIEKVAVINGSGADYINTALYKGCQCVITGDVKYHDAQDAISQGITVIDIGHYDSEKFFSELLVDYLKKAAKEKGLDLEIMSSNIDINPFKIV